MLTVWPQLGSLRLLACIYSASNNCCTAAAGVIITAVDSFILLLIDRLGVRHLEAMFGILVGLMAAAFGLMFADAGVDVGQVLQGERCS